MDNNVKSVLLVMDIQAGTMSRLGDTPEAKQLIGNLQSAIDAARSSGIPVIYVVVGFRKGLPEIALSNKSFSALKQMPAEAVAALEEATVFPALTPRKDEPVVTKRRISAFAGSDLDVLLRAYEARHLILTGISTSGVVLSTLREAADKDYQLSVLSDCCADLDPEVHTVLLTKVFSRHAAVLTTAEWISRSLQAK